VCAFVWNKKGANHSSSQGRLMNNDSAFSALSCSVRNTALHVKKSTETAPSTGSLAE